MITRTALIAIALLALSLPAMAYHCPADMKKIDAALMDGPQLSEAQMSEVKSLRADGQADHEAGRHDDSVAKLGKAMEILGIK